MASVLAVFDSAEHVEQASEGLFDNMGAVRWRQGQGNAAIALYQKPREIMPHPDNPAVRQPKRQDRQAGGTDG